VGSLWNAGLLWPRHGAAWSLAEDRCLLVAVARERRLLLATIARERRFRPARMLWSKIGTTLGRSPLALQARYHALKAGKRLFKRQ